MSSKLKYRADIDGLRAIAVGTVFLFHLNENWLPGGFIGVDVFFVISGFLITTILYTDIEAGQLSFAKFYQRRISRLFPMILIVSVATLIAASIIYSAQDFASAGINFVAAVLSVANIKFLLQGNYFELSPDAQPFLHFWSLSVEEQFYLVFPPLLWAMHRWARKYLLTLIAAMTIVSFIACVLLTFRSPSAAFYLLPTRAWELGVGGLIGILMVRNQLSVPSALARWLPLLGVVLILVTSLLLHESMGFPGYMAALPVVGTAAILIGCLNGPYVGYNVLAAAPMVALGKLSYSLYLWHWPVFSMTDYALFTQSDELRYAIKIGLSFGLTLLTYYVIENPTRRFFNRASKQRFAYAGFAIIAMSCVPVGLQIRADNYVNAELRSVSDGGLYFEAGEGRPTIVLMGDSHGSMHGRMIRDICWQLDCNLHVLSVAGEDALPPIEGHSPPELWSASIKAIKTIQPDVLIIANAWERKLRRDRTRVERTLSEVRADADRIILINQPPMLPNTVTRESVRQGAKPPFFEPDFLSESRNSANALLLEFGSETVEVVDIASAFQGTENDVLFFDQQGRLLYHDETHLSKHGTDRIRGYVKDAIEAAL
ncbi:MAG: acyltransferase family protein [Pseudomonadota bacterium]